MSLRGIISGVCGQLGPTYNTAPSYIGQSSSMAAGRDSISVGVAANYQANDILILQLGGYSATPDTPNGWTSISTQNTTTTYLRVCYKIAGASESSVTVADSGKYTVGIMYAYRGVDAVNVINTYTGNTDSGSTFSANSITTTVTNCMVVVFVSFNDSASGTDNENYSSWANDNLGSLTERHDQITRYSDTELQGLAMATGTMATAGATGATTATTDSSSNKSAIIIIALTPAA